MDEECFVELQEQNQKQSELLEGPQAKRQRREVTSVELEQRTSIARLQQLHKRQRLRRGQMFQIESLQLDVIQTLETLQQRHCNQLRREEMQSEKTS